MHKFNIRPDLKDRFHIKAIAGVAMCLLLSLNTATVTAYAQRIRSTPSNVTVTIEGTGDEKKGKFTVTSVGDRKLFDVKGFMPGESVEANLRFENKDDYVVHVMMFVNNKAVEAKPSETVYDVADILDLTILSAEGDKTYYEGPLKMDTSGQGADRKGVEVGQLQKNEVRDLLFFLEFPGNEKKELGDKYRHNNYMLNSTDFEVEFLIRAVVPESPPPGSENPDGPDPSPSSEGPIRPGPTDDGWVSVPGGGGSSGGGSNPVPTPGVVLQPDDVPAGPVEIEPTDYMLFDDDIPEGAFEFDPDTDEMPETGEQSLIYNVVIGGMIVLAGAIYASTGRKKKNNN